MGLILTWLGIAALWVAFHGTNATTPWGIWQQILGQGQSSSATEGTAQAATGSEQIAGSDATASPQSTQAIPSPRGVTGQDLTGGGDNSFSHLLGGGG